jgi:uncharacterized protein YkwD
MTISSGKAIPLWGPVALGLLVVAALFLSLSTPHVGIAGPQLGQDEEALLDLINGHRVDNGLSPLSISPTLTDAALWMSRDMAENDYFSHTDSLGRDPFQRMADFGYDYNTWKGENLAAGSDTPQMTFELWRESSGHNANMLSSNFVVVGLAKAYGPNSTYGWYWAAEFGGYDEAGSPPPSPPEPTPTPEPPPPSPPEPTPTPEPPPPSPPEPTPTPEPPPTTPAPTQTPEPPPSTPAPTQTPEPPPSTPVTRATPTPEGGAPPISERLSPEAEPILEVGFSSPPGADLGFAPPTRDSESVDDKFESAPMVRELAPGWNQFQCPPGSTRLTEVLPVDNGKLMAIYAWDEDKGTWRRYLRGIDIPGLNTLTELRDQQPIWILASGRFLLTLPT